MREEKYLFYSNRFSLTHFSPLLSIGKRHKNEAEFCLKHVDDDVETLKPYTPLQKEQSDICDGFFLFCNMEKRKKNLNNENIQIFTFPLFFVHFK